MHNIYNPPLLREVKKGLGIFQFTADDTSLKSTVHPESLQVSKVAPRNTVVVVSYTQHYIFVSRNYGRDWDQYVTPTTQFDPSGSLYLSEKDPRHLVIKSRSGDVRLN